MGLRWVSLNLAVIQTCQGTALKPRVHLARLLPWSCKWTQEDSNLRPIVLRVWALGVAPTKPRGHQTSTPLRRLSGACRTTSQSRVEGRGSLRLQLPQLQLSSAYPNGLPPIGYRLVHVHHPRAHTRFTTRLRFLECRDSLVTSCYSIESFTVYQKGN